MIKVNRNSWHYKLWKFMYGSGRNDRSPLWKLINKGTFELFEDSTRSGSLPRSLCFYGWGFILMPFAAFCIILFFSLISILMLTVYAIAVWVIYKPVKYGVVGVKHGVLAVKKRIPEREPKEPVEKEPNLTWEWIKAMHNKACPLLELKDE